jgi:hypothetical protein
MAFGFVHVQRIEGLLRAAALALQDLCGLLAL